MLKSSASNTDKIQYFRIWIEFYWLCSEHDNILATIEKGEN